jgi:Ca-activated chloride channel homolog
MKRAAGSLLTLLILFCYVAGHQQETPPKPPTLRGTGADPKAKPSETPKEEPREVGEDEVVKVNTSLVTIPFSVVDGAGRSVLDLKRGDVKVFEDGAEQQVAFFSETEKPTLIVFLLDVSGSVKPSLERIKTAALAFMDQLKENDYVYLVAFDDRLMPLLPKATNDRAALREAIEDFSGGGGGTGLYGFFHLINDRVLSRVQGRRALILFTDGIDTRSRHISKGDTLSEAEELGFPVFTVKFPGSDSAPIFGMSYTKYMKKLAELTGGRYYEGKNTQEIRESFAAIAEELRHQYVIGYYAPTPARRGQPRRVSLKISRPGLHPQTNKTSVQIQ